MSTGAIWPLISLPQTPQPFWMCSNSDSPLCSLRPVCSQERVGIQWGWPKTSLCCCPIGHFCSAWKSEEQNAHLAPPQCRILAPTYLRELVLVSAEPAIHLNLSWSLGSARQCSILLLVLRMLILGTGQEQSGRAVQSLFAMKDSCQCVCQSHKSYVLKYFPPLSITNVSHHIIFGLNKHL